MIVTFNDLCPATGNLLEPFVEPTETPQAPTAADDSDVAWWSERLEAFMPEDDMSDFALWKGLLIRQQEISWRRRMGEIVVTRWAFIACMQAESVKSPAGVRRLRILVSKLAALSVELQRLRIALDRRD